MRPPLNDIQIPHSALIYNLNHTTRDKKVYGRDAFGRFRSGAWGRDLAGNEVFGKDVWAGYHPPFDLSAPDGAWHGATDLMGDIQVVHSIAPGEVKVRRPNDNYGGFLAIMHDLPNGGHFLAVYRHLISNYPEGIIVKEGEPLGRLADINGVHLHLEILSLVDLWDYERMDEEEAKGFFIRYARSDGNLRSQMSTSWLAACGITYPCFTYVGLKFIEHWN